MATMTMEPAIKINQKAIENAFEKMNLQDRLGELWDAIDEAELDRRLKISEEQCERGEGMSVEEAKKITGKYLENLLCKK